MSMESHQTIGKSRAGGIGRLGGIVANVFFLSILWALLTTGSSLIALDRFTMRQLLDGVLPAIGIFWAATVVVLGIKAGRQRKRPDRNKPLSRKQATWLLAPFVAVVAVTLAMTFIQTRTDDQLLAQSAHYFSAQTLGNVSRDQTDRTLIELTRPVASLERAWHISPQVISVVIFADRTLLLQTLDLPSWYGGATIIEPGGPIIYLPTESGGNRWSGVSPTSTPSHELVHALMGLALGQDTFDSVPSWFHEGVAEYESLKGIQHLPSRSLNRVAVWLLRDELPQTGEFLSFDPASAESKVGIFYATSYEVIRFIAARHGETALSSIIAAMRQGLSFDMAVLKTTGQTSSQVYESWRQS